MDNGELPDLVMGVEQGLALCAERCDHLEHLPHVQQRLVRALQHVQPRLSGLHLGCYRRTQLQLVALYETAVATAERVTRCWAVTQVTVVPFQFLVN
jgi:hypothetical protein